MSLMDVTSSPCSTTVLLPVTQEHWLAVFLEPQEPSSQEVSLLQSTPGDSPALVSAAIAIAIAMLMMAAMAHLCHTLSVTMLQAMISIAKFKFEKRISICVSLQ